MKNEKNNGVKKNEKKVVSFNQNFFLVFFIYARRMYHKYKTEKVEFNEKKYSDQNLK